MANLDDAENLDLEQRARELSEQADRLRQALPEPAVEQDSKSEADEDLDRRLEESLDKLRKLAK